MAGATILHLEDQHFMRSLIRAVCEKLGHLYIGAENLGKAAEILSETRVQYIICDIAMGDDDAAGFAFLKQLRANPDHHGAVVIMLTQFREEQILRDALEKGADDYLIKPVRADRLRQAFDRWSGVADAEVDWVGLDQRQARLLRLTLGTLGHAFDVVAKGGEPPLELVRERCFDLLQAAADDQVIGILGELRRKDGRTFAHSLRMAGYLAFYAHSRGLDRDQMKEIATAGLLHDIGISRMDPAFMEKPRWTEAEARWFVATHINHNQDILHSLDERLPPEVQSIYRSVVCQHHERLDGSGPLGLAADDLDQDARMAAIIDHFLDMRTPGERGKSALFKPAALTQILRARDWTRN